MSAELLFDAEDPRLSAYAFGELEGAEKAAVEALLARDAAARAFVDELRATASELERELANEPKLELSAEQRANIAAEAIGARPIVSLGRSRLRWYGALAAAASIAAAALVGYRLLRDDAKQGRFAYDLDGEAGSTLAKSGGPVSGAPVDAPVDTSLGEASSAARAARSSDLLAKNEPARRQNARLGEKDVNEKRGDAASTSAAQLPPPSTAAPQVPTAVAEAVQALTAGSDELAANTRGAQSEQTLHYGVDGALSESERQQLVALGYAGKAPSDGTAPTAGTELKLGVAAGALPSGTYRGAGDSMPPSAGPSSPGVAGHVSGGVPAAGESAVQPVASRGGRAPYGRVKIAKTLATNSDDFFNDRDGWQLQQTKAKDDAEFNTEAYDAVPENPFKLVKDDPRSTFSIDVDTASYSNVRRMLVQENRLPSPGAVRIEELLNYFRYAYPAPDGATPFSVTTEVGSAPWSPTHRLVRVGLRGRDIPVAERKQNNLVFLLDVSGSMDEPNKLPLVQRSLRLLVEQLDERDRVAIVVYAGSEGLALPSTSCVSKATILNAVDQLKAGGSTNGGAGIKLAYKTARENLLKDGTNRVILCTDGDFNVGVSSDDELVALIEQERKSGVFLSVLGFGSGNLKDSKMEQLADKGNGNYAYVDTLAEARKVLVAEMGGTLIPIAKDVKLQLEFNAANVQAWRLIGYENRVLAHQDFKDDTKDAGELGAGTCVTALYEIVPTGVPFEAPSVDPLRYQQPLVPTIAGASGELLNVKLRYKQPNGDVSTELEFPTTDKHLSVHEASVDFKFAASVAGFGMLLRKSQFVGADFDIGDVQRLAVEGLGDDKEGYRSEFATLVAKARTLWPQPETTTGGVK